MMQDNSIEIFIDDINNIRMYIKYIELVNKIEINNRVSDDELLIKFREHLHTYGVSKKLFEYKAITISLYGILEKHIGLWISEYIEQLPKIVLNYNDLTEKFRKDHFNLSVKLISLICENKYSKYENIKKEDVLARLNSCIDNPHSYELNGDAFYLHSGNLKHSKIVEAFNYLDIKLTARLKVVGRRTEGFLCGSGENVSNRGDELFKMIDDLVVRRNEIAHGENIDNILNISEFGDYVDFLEGYGKSIFQTLVEKNNEYEANHLYKKIDNVKGIHQAGSILCFEVENNEINKGDYIIMQIQDGSFFKKEILEIQKDNKNFDSLSITSSENVGVNLGGGLASSHTFFIKIKQI